MPKLVYLLISLPNKSPASARSFASLSRLQLAQPRHGLLNEPWLPPTSVSLLPTTYFSPSRVREELDGGEGTPQRNDHKPPDERTLKLGKSKHVVLIIVQICWTNIIKSITDPITPTPNHFVQHSPHQNPRPKREPPSLPIHTPTPPNSQRTHPLPRSTMDSPSRMEQRPLSRKREATDPQRKDRTLRHTTRSIAQR
jgi:hypothetical protein